MKRGILHIVALGLCGLFCVAFIVKNYRHGIDERHSRAQWTRQNGEMLDFVRDHVVPGAGVFQLVDDPECSITFRTYITGTRGKELRHWTSMPMNVPRIDGKWDPANRSIPEMKKLLSEAKRGDMLLVPVTRANVSYIRMPLFSQASRLLPHIVSEDVQKRLTCIYSKYEQYQHKSIPPQVRAYLAGSGKDDILASLRKTGMQLGFGWQIYQFQ